MKLQPASFIYFSHEEHKETQRKMKEEDKYMEFD